MGAENDPRAPWNEQPETETEVTVRAVLVKELCLLGVRKRQSVEYEYDPDTGKRVPYGYWEADDLMECYNDQEHSLTETLERCGKVCKQLLEEGHRFYAHVNIQDLMSECDDWEVESLEVREL